MTLAIDRFDHIVLNVKDVETSAAWYEQVLGMKREDFESRSGKRVSVKFGQQKINLHVRGREFEPKAHLPVPGALDLCFIATVPLAQVIERLQAAAWPIIEGPVMRTGATQKIRSVYVRDPDLNLIEISELA